MSVWRVHCARLVGEKHTQQGAMDFEMSIVVNEPQFTKLVHEVLTRDRVVPIISASVS